MPQFDTSTFPSMIFWLLTCFTITVLFYTKIVIPKHNKGIEKRLQAICLNLEKAQKNDLKCEELIALCEEKIRTTTQDTDALFTKIYADLEKTAVADIDQLKNDFAVKSRVFEKSIQEQNLQYEALIKKEVENAATVICNVLFSQHDAVKEGITK